MSTGCVLDVDGRRLGALASVESAVVPACEPAAHRVHSVRELDSLVLRVECASTPDLTLTPQQLPAGAMYDAQAHELRWSPGLDQAGLYEVAFGSSSGVRHVVEIGVVDRWDHPDNVPVDPSIYTVEYGVPVFHLFTDPELNADEYTDARVVYQGREYPGAMAKFRGSSSLSYPKKSFTLKFDKGDPLDDTTRDQRERRLVLTTTFDDSTELRQRLAFELWNRLDPEHIQIAAYHAVLFLDGSYQGVYLATDHVDDELMEENGLWAGGNLYKARTHDANFRLKTRRGATKSSLNAGYTKEEGSPAAEEPSAYADLEELVNFVASASPDGFNDELSTRLRWEDFADWFILTSALQAEDSAGKNSYLYRDPRATTRDARWRCVPWDFNASFGQDWATARTRADTDPEALRRFNGLFDRLLEEPTQRASLFTRYHKALAGPLALDSVLAQIDAWAEHTRAVAERDHARWGTEMAAYRAKSDIEFVPYEADLDYLRAWITERWSLLAEHALAERSSTESTLTGAAD